MTTVHPRSAPRRPRFPGPISLVGAAAVWAAAAGCRGDPPPPEFPPDSVLRAELGLTDSDAVHRVTITGGATEVLDPPEVYVAPDAWVEFVTSDWRVHVVLFEADSLSAEGLAFLQRTDQMGSPPLVDRDARFVVSFSDAPAGRYPYVVEGNGGPAHGVVVVVPSR